MRFTAVVVVLAIASMTCAQDGPKAHPALSGELSEDSAELATIADVNFDVVQALDEYDTLPPTVSVEYAELMGLATTWEEHDAQLATFEPMLDEICEDLARTRSGTAEYDYAGIDPGPLVRVLVVDKSRQVWKGDYERSLGRLAGMLDLSREQLRSFGDPADGYMAIAVLRSTLATIVIELSRNEPWIDSDRAMVLLEVLDTIDPAEIDWPPATEKHDPSGDCKGAMEATREWLAKVFIGDE